PHIPPHPSSPTRRSSDLLLPQEADRAVGDRPLEDVVGEHHHAAVAVDEPLRQAERLRDPARLLLVRVREEVDAVRVPVAEQPEEDRKSTRLNSSHEWISY